MHLYMLIVINFMIGSYQNMADIEAVKTRFSPGLLE